MPKLNTKERLRLRVLRRLDMLLDDFATYQEVDVQLQASWEKLYNYCVGKYESYFAKHATEADIKAYKTDIAGLTSGLKDYYFPADYFKIRRLSLGRGTRSVAAVAGSPLTAVGGEPWRDLFRTEWEEEYRLNPNSRLAFPTHYIRSGRIDYTPATTGERAEGFRLVPTPDRAYPLDLVYIPTAPNVDEINFVNGWDSYVVFDTCIELRDREEGDCSVLMHTRDAYLATIENAIANPDAGQAAVVTQAGYGILSEDWEELAY